MIVVLRYPKLTVTVTLDKAMNCSKCAGEIPPFAPMFFLALEIQSLAGKPLCWACGSIESGRRAAEIKAAHDNPDPTAPRPPSDTDPRPTSEVAVYSRGPGRACGKAKS